MNAVTFPFTSPISAALSISEKHRLSLLAISDRLLNEVEELRLSEQSEVPLHLYEVLAKIHSRLGLPYRRRHIPKLNVIHDLVFSLQERLLALNPDRPLPLQHPGRAAGCPALLQIGKSQQWKLLFLPSRPEDPDQLASWQESVKQTISRAFDRWDYAHHHALLASRAQHNQSSSWQLEQIAWKNYCDLLEEATRLGILN